MTDEQQPEETTPTSKQAFRSLTWEQMTKAKLIRYPNIQYRIPNFKGASEAAQQLAKLSEFQNAKLVYIQTHKSQIPVRYLTLEANKEIVMPIHGYRFGQFLHIAVAPDRPKKELKSLSKIPVLKKAGTVVDITSTFKIDLMILGSVCVSKEGYRIGDGTGMADLEFAVLKRMGAVTAETVIVTIVHDTQVLDKLPNNLFNKHDVPVDIIVTPTQVITISPKLEKPNGIVWQMLCERDLKTAQLLQQLREEDEKNGIDVTLKQVDPQSDNFKDTHKRSRRHQRRTPIRSNNGLRSNSVQDTVDDDNKKSRQNAKTNKSPSKKEFEFSLKLSNMSKGVTVRDLKNALMERGVKPNGIRWLGYRGVCYLYFSKLRKKDASPEEPIQVDSIMAKLQQLHIGKQSIIVEPAKPISRIEVTDVTSV